MIYFFLGCLVFAQTTIALYSPTPTAGWTGVAITIAVVIFIVCHHMMGRAEDKIERGEKDKGNVEAVNTTPPGAVIATPVSVVEHNDPLPRDTLSEPSKTILEMIEADTKWVSDNGKDGRWKVCLREASPISGYGVDYLEVQDTQGSFKCSWRVCRGTAYYNTQESGIIYSTSDVEIMGKEIHSLYNKLLDEPIRKKKEAQKARLIEEYCGGTK